VSIPFYPLHLHSLFTDRERELARLRQATDDLAAGRPRHLALFGLRRIGKPLLLLEHATRLLETIPTGPVRPVYGLRGTADTPTPGRGGSVRLKDLRVPPANRLEKLRGDRAGQHSIRINDQWRICFEWRNGDAYDVEITDYH